MRTILLGLATVPAWYAVQAIVVAQWVNGVSGVSAALWILLVLLASAADACCRDVITQGHRRVRVRLVGSALDTWQHSALTTLRDLIRRGREVEASLTSTKPKER